MDFDPYKSLPTGHVLCFCGFDLWSFLGDVVSELMHVSGWGCLLKAFPLGICHGRSCDHPARPHFIWVSGEKEAEQAQTLGVTEVTTTPGSWDRTGTQEGRKGNLLAELCLHFAFRGFLLFLSFPNDWRGNVHSNQLCLESQFGN